MDTREASGIGTDTHGVDPGAEADSKSAGRFRTGAA